MVLSNRKIILPVDAKKLAETQWVTESNLMVLYAYKCASEFVGQNTLQTWVCFLRLSTLCFKKAIFFMNLGPCETSISMFLLLPKDLIHKRGQRQTYVCTCLVTCSEVIS